MKGMLRRDMLLATSAAGIALVASPAALGRRRRGDGFTTIPYEPVDARPFFRPGKELWANKHQIDPKIWPAVRDINRSGWVWTAESCEGDGWSSVPMVRLVARAADAEAMLGVVYRNAGARRSERPWSMELRLRKNNAVLPGWTEMQVFAPHISFFERIARAFGEH